MLNEELKIVRSETNKLLEQIDPNGEKNQINEHTVSKVLVVDDEEIMRHLLSDVLSEEGYTVSSFPRAEDALQKVLSGGISIVITDVKMKGMNGMELLKKIKENTPDVDVIVMTGYASVNTAVESMKLGAIDYLTKPLNIDQIRIIVNKTSEQRSLRRKADESVFYKKLSQLDGLTDLFNHRFFQQLMQIEIARSDRENHPVSLIMIDIDNFKLFNDKNGHPIGDLALKKLSWLLKENSRDCDFVARYGGEEFAVILPNVTKQGAEHMANRIRKVVEETKFEHEELLPIGRFTISMGIAEYPKDAQNREQLIQKADQALYAAKKNGKNMVCIYAG
ncbi:MAG: diguanylate cyclase [Candidatus Schekmanbacteria bacterium]|nr:diguanylate cyclase [Candidatus Schekmanbacteria bacterium]